MIKAMAMYIRVVMAFRFGRFMLRLSGWTKKEANEHIKTRLRNEPLDDVLVKMILHDLSIE